MNSAKPTVVVVNGSADEGYWSVRYLLETGRFNVRATVRSKDSARARRVRELDVRGARCDVVEASTIDAKALEAAFGGATGIYGTSLYNIYAKKYDPENPEEIAQAQAVVDAAKACSTLENFVWQTMTRFDTPPEDLGLESPIHFRTKWAFEEVINDAHLPWTFLRQPAYMRQLRFGMQYGKRLVYPYPKDTRLAFVSEEDLGKLVAAVFCNRDRLLHESLNAVSEVVTPVQIAERFHALDPDFRPGYRRATWIENAFFDHVIVRLKPAFRYPSQINANLAAGNSFAMTADDKAACTSLIAPLKLATLEDWYREQKPGGCDIPART